MVSNNLPESFLYGRVFRTNWYSINKLLLCQRPNYISYNSIYNVFISRGSNIFYIADIQGMQRNERRPQNF
jgi:hypothetical protein